MNKILGLVESGVKQGASLQTGGAQFGDKGFFMQPTVFADVQDHMDISTQEVRIFPNRYVYFIERKLCDS